MRFAIFLLLIVCFGCNKSDGNLAADIAQLEGQIANLDVRIANETGFIKSPNRQTVVIVDDSNTSLYNNSSERYGGMTLVEENEIKKHIGNISQLKSQREVLVGKQMILYQLEQSSRK